MYDHKPIDDEHPEEIGLRQLEFVTEEVYQAQVDAEGFYEWQGGNEIPGVYIPK